MATFSMPARTCIATDALPENTGQSIANQACSRTFVDVELIAGVVVVQMNPHVVAACRPALSLRTVAGTLHGVGRLQDRYM